ncbi:MAG: hypothetical protein KF836_09455 [Fimbriimonadaceae bacterium]|nr:hypothetical protein [Fimbriimonadaceae bacterium]
MESQRLSIKSPLIGNMLALFWSILTVFIVVMVLGLGGHIFNVDERELLYSVADRFAGVPSTSLAWPASTIQLLLVPFLLLAGCFGVLQDRSPSGFTRVVSDLYGDPHQWMIFSRFLLLLVYFLLCWNICKVVLKKLNPAVLLPLLGIASAPIFMKQGIIFGGDVLGMLSCTLAACILLTSEGRRPEIIKSSILLGISIASRATFGLYFPLFLMLILLLSRKDEVWKDEGSAVLKRLIWCGTIVTASFVAVCPYAWTDPLRMVKSVLGNAGRSGESVQLAERLTDAFFQIGPVFWLIVLVAVFYGSWKGKTISFICLGFGLALLAVLCKVGVIFDRYFLLLMPAFFAATFTSGVEVKFSQIRVATASIALGSLLQLTAFVLPILTGAVERNHQERAFRSYLSQIAETETVYVDFAVIQHVDMRVFATDSLNSQIKITANGLMNTVIRGQVPRANSYVSTFGVPWNFVEDELALQARLNAVAVPIRKGASVELYANDSSMNERYNLPGLPNGENQGLIVSSIPIQEYGSPKLRIGDELFLYER